MHAQIAPMNITRLCNQYTIITVNGQLPGPTLYVYNGDTVIVNVINNAQYNATIHWYVTATSLIEEYTSVVGLVIDRFDYKTHR